MVKNVKSNAATKTKKSTEKSAPPSARKKEKSAAPGAGKPSAGMLAAIEIIKKKRDGGKLSDDEISFFLKGYLHGKIPDYQMSALLMAAWLRGLSKKETKAFTEEMLFSGDRLDFSHLPQAKVDKHSTGGVGDKTSLVVAPIAAAAGLYVPMISGRGLSHTGGTLDKLESIPGFNAHPAMAEFRRIVEKVGAAIIGQTEEIAPIDRLIYALRDATGTVESIPLITASIMSKKLAEGLDALALDVKCGNGAFMKTEERARALAESLVATGKRMKKRTAAIITDMNQPLGWAVGNSLEVIESIEALKGNGMRDFVDLCIELAAMMLYLGNAASDLAEGRKKASALISSGKALEKFRAMVEAQGGDPRIVDNVSLLPQARISREVRSHCDGYVTEIETESIGLAAMGLGAGRSRVDSPIDYSVGIRLHAKIGARIGAGHPLCTIYGNDENLIAEAERRFIEAYKIGDERPSERKLVIEMIQ